MLKPDRQTISDSAWQANGIAPVDGGKRKADSQLSPAEARGPKKARTEAAAPVGAQSAVAAPSEAGGVAQGGPAAAAAVAQGGGFQRRGWLLPPPEPLPTLSVKLGVEERVLDGDAGDGTEGGVARTFEAAARKDGAGRPVAVLSCSAGGRRLWVDELSGRPAAIAGTLHYAAAALVDGTLQASDAQSHSLATRRRLQHSAFAGSCAGVIC
jgi:hypothetical protein